MAYLFKSELKGEQSMSTSQLSQAGPEKLRAGMLTLTIPLGPLRAPKIAVTALAEIAPSISVLCGIWCFHFIGCRVVLIRPIRRLTLLRGVDLRLRCCGFCPRSAVGSLRSLRRRCLAGVRLHRVCRRKHGDRKRKCIESYLFNFLSTWINHPRKTTSRRNGRFQGYKCE